MEKVEALSWFWCLSGVSDPYSYGENWIFVRVVWDIILVLLFPSKRIKEIVVFSISIWHILIQPHNDFTTILDPVSFIKFTNLGILGRCIEYRSGFVSMVQMLASLGYVGFYISNF